MQLVFDRDKMLMRNFKLIDSLLNNWKKSSKNAYEETQENTYLWIQEVLYQVQSNPKFAENPFEITQINNNGTVQLHMGDQDS